LVRKLLLLGFLAVGFGAGAIAGGIDIDAPMISGDVSSPQSAGHADLSSQQELLPEVIIGVMDSATDNVCPHWDSPTRAKEIIVYLTVALESWDEINRTGVANSRLAGLQAVASMDRHIQEVEPHLQALLTCRDLIAQQLGMDKPAVERMVRFNSRTSEETLMFTDLENNYSGQPNYFSKFLAMPDQRKALHMIDLELRELDFGIPQRAASLVNDAGNAREDLDRRILARETIFRKALVVVRARIAKKLAGAASQGSGSAIAQGHKRTV
jgi:hypothetical protein